MKSMKRKRFFGNNPRFKVPRSSDVPGCSNRFKVFEEEDDMDTFSEDSSFIPAAKEKFPPIIVDGTISFSNVLKMLGKQYIFQRMSIGTKIISPSLVLYEEATKKLKLVGFTFYTHQLQDNKKFKLVLFGLPKLEIATINDEFKQTHNIQPVSIKEISTKRSSVDDALYMIEFDKQQVSKREIHKIRYFNGIVVKWRNPIKGKKGPTQCNKCAMYGHGSSNCHRSPVCSACAGNHDVSTCPLSKTQHQGPVVYKCFNCVKKKLSNVNHKADDPKCPCRQEYLDIRGRVTSANTSRLKINKHVSMYDLSPADFPSALHNNNTGTSRSYVRLADNLTSGTSIPHAKSAGHTTADFQSSYARPNVNHRVSYANIIDNNSQVECNDDISNEKLLDIYFEAIDALQKCRNKYDKLRVLGMMLRHAL